MALFQIVFIPRFFNGVEDLKLTTKFVMTWKEEDL